MRRRWMALIIALTIALAAPAVPAAAEETPPAGADLFDLYIYEGDGMTRVGCAAPLMDGILVTAATVGRRDGLAVSDGRAAWDAELAYTEKNGLLTVVFYDVSEHAPALGNYQLPPFGEALTGDSLHVRGGDDEGSRINRAVRHVSVIPWMGTECLLLNLSGPAEIGSAVLTDQGELAGILAAQYAEGENRYIAMTAESIYRAAAEAAENLQSLDLTASGPEGYTVTAEENLVTFDWSGMEMTPPEAGETRYLVVADMGNAYLTYFPVTEESTAVRMLLTPGRTYVSGFYTGEGTPDDYPEQYVITALPEAQPLTDYGFRSTACMLAAAPETGLPDGERPEAVTEITEELLRSGRVYFYSSSVYDVEETIEDLSLLVTLTAPDGENYRYTSGWLYDPALEKEDTWFVRLEDTGLLESLNLNGYPAGTYEMAFYVGGKLGDSFTFDLP